ncbi:MAG: efflux RND transporter periplasmic adaptor subunit [Myxococcaceae bacterium]|jgi:HlyD family secretion protein|nr:efflux RND transporter periplasmic adaptor subunit [Myxococcaceae bacterium]
MSRHSLVVLALSSVTLAACSQKPAAGPKYTTAKVDTGPVIGRVTATGTVSALVTVQVGAQVSGRIQSLNVDFNSKVTKGQVLAKLDPSLFEAALSMAQANEKAALAGLTRAQAQEKDAQRKLARAKTLADQKLVPLAELESAQAELEVAQANIQAAEGSVAQARAARQQAQVNLAYTTITSPIDGTVVSRAVDVGQTVAASLQAPTLFTIAENLSKMQVDTNVAEADVGKLSDGMEASFSVDAFPTRVFKGRIRQIRYAPQVVQNVVTYDAVIDVANDELLLRPGMTANVSFVYARADDALRVPNAALRFRPDAELARKAGKPEPGKRLLWVLDGETPTAMPVSVGLSDGTMTVVQGLSEGAQVITEKQDSGGSGGARPSGLGGPSMGGGGMRRAF